MFIIFRTTKCYNITTIIKNNKNIFKYLIFIDCKWCGSGCCIGSVVDVGYGFGSAVDVGSNVGSVIDIDASVVDSDIDANDDDDDNSCLFSFIFFHFRYRFGCAVVDGFVVGLVADSDGAVVDGNDDWGDDDSCNNDDSCSLSSSPIFY